MLVYKPKVKTHLFKLAFCKSRFNLFFFLHCSWNDPQYLKHFHCIFIHCPMFCLFMLSSVKHFGKRFGFCKLPYELKMYWLIDWKSTATKQKKIGWIEIIDCFFTLSYSWMELHFLLWEFSVEQFRFLLKLQLESGSRRSCITFTVIHLLRAENVYINLTICNTSKWFRIIL